MTAMPHLDAKFSDKSWDHNLSNQLRAPGPLRDISDFHEADNTPDTNTSLGFLSSCPCCGGRVVVNCCSVCGARQVLFPKPEWLAAGAAVIAAMVAGAGWWLGMGMVSTSFAAVVCGVVAFSIPHVRVVWRQKPSR